VASVLTFGLSNIVIYILVRSWHIVAVRVYDIFVWHKYIIYFIFI